jgi:hypothetical protein
VKMKKLRKTFSKLKNKGAGPDGVPNSHWRSIAKRNSKTPKAKKAMELHAWLAEKLMNAELPDWYMRVISAVNIIAIVKSEAATEEEAPDVRPIGMGDTWKRAVLASAARSDAMAIGATYNGLQVAVGTKDGLSKLLFVIQTTMEKNQDFVLIKLDLKNAYNAAERAAILKAIQANPATRKWAPYFHQSLSIKAKMLGLGATEAENGLFQGGPESTFAFTTVIQDDVVNLNKAVQKAGGVALFMADDGYVAGPLKESFDAVLKFKKDLYKRTGLELVIKKCESYMEDTPRLREYISRRPELKDFTIGAMDGVDTETTQTNEGCGMVVVGVPVGSDQYKSNYMRCKSEFLEEDLQTLTCLLSKGQTHLQLALALILWCDHPRIDYWLQNVKPKFTRAAAARVDKAILKAVGKITDQQLSTLADDDVVLERLRLPTCFFGAGIRSKAAMKYVCFLAQQVKNLRSMGDMADVETGVKIKGFNQATFVLLTVGADGEELDEANFCDGRSALGIAVKKAFEVAKCQAGHPKDVDQIFGKTIGGVLQMEDRKVQEKMTDQIEQHRKKELNKRFVRMAAKDPRKKAWFNTRKELGGFLRSSPTGEKQKHGLLNTELQTMFAIWMGMEVPILRGYEGQKFGSQDQILDVYGAKLMSTNLPGDAWRTRHDDMKIYLYKLMQQAGMDCRCEVYHEFSRFMATEVEDGPAEVEGDQEGAADGEEAGQQGQRKSAQQLFNERPRKINQGCVPDLKGDGNMPEGGKNKWLGELKTINMGQIYEKVTNGKRCEAVEKRAKRIHGSYVNKINKLDEKFNKVTERQARPAVLEIRDEEGNITTHAREAVSYRAPGVARRCASHLQGFGRVQGFVFGSYGEWNKDVDVLLKKCIGMIAEKTWADAGFLCVEDALSVYTAMVKQDLAFESLKGVAGLLIGRVCQVGFNSNMAVRRITQDVRTYDRMRERRQDQLSYENQNPNTYGEHLAEGH